MRARAHRTGRARTTTPHAGRAAPIDADHAPCRTKKPRSDKGRRHEQPESRLQVKCVSWAASRNFMVDGSPGGAVYKYGGRTANAMKARGCRAGRPDLLILEQGADGAPGLAVELKIGENTLSDPQALWLSQVAARGWRVAVARTYGEFKQHVLNHVGLADDDEDGADEEADEAALAAAFEADEEDEEGAEDGEEDEAPVRDVAPAQPARRLGDTESEPIDIDADDEGC